MQRKGAQMAIWLHTLWRDIFRREILLGNMGKMCRENVSACLVFLKSLFLFISKGFLKQIEVKIIGKIKRRFDRTSVIIKLKSEDKIFAYT